MTFRRFQFAVLALFVATAPAAAQDKPADPVESATLHFWKIGMNPTVGARDIGRDYNIRNEADNPKEDFTATITSKADVYFHPGPLLVTYSQGADYMYFRKYKEERGTNNGQSVRLDFTLGPIKPFVSAGGLDSKDRINREIDVRARRHETTYAGGVSVQILEPLGAGVTFKQVTTSFASDAQFRGERLDQALNQVLNTVEFSTGFNVTPLTAVSLQVTAEQDRFTLDPERNSHSLRIMPRVTFSPLAMLQGSASLGYRRFSPDTTALESFHGFVATLGLGTTLLERHHIDAIFSRDLQYSYERDTPLYVETGVNLTWTFALFGPIDIRLNANRARLNYRAAQLNSNDDDDVGSGYALGIIYRIKETLRAGLNVDWRGRTSERAHDRTYQNHRIYANMTWGK